MQREEVNERMRELRTARGWSFRDLAKRAGVSASTVFRMERRRNKPLGVYARAVAKALRCRIDDIL